MFDLMGMVNTALAKMAGEDVAIAAPYELSGRLCSNLIESGKISAVVLDSPPEAGPKDGRVAGWWVDTPGRQWFIRPNAPKTIMLFGATLGEELSGQMLLEARLKGVRRIVMVGWDGAFVQDIDTTDEVVRRLEHPVPQPFGDRTYDVVFSEIYRMVGDSWRLPPDAFPPRRAMVLVGSMGPGGAERQAAFTAVGLGRSGAYDPIVVCNYLSPPSDFYVPILTEAGAEVVEVDRALPSFEDPEICAIRSRMMYFDSLGAQNIFHQIFHYADIIRRHPPGVLHTWMDYCNVLAGIAADLIGVPRLIMGGRSMAPHHFPEAVHHPYMRPGYQAILAHRPVLMLNNSQAGAKDYAHWLGLQDGRVRVVNNGFEFPEDASGKPRAAVRKAHGIPQDAIVLGGVMRFSEEKNPKLLIDTARVLHANNSKVHLLVFGQGPQLEPLREYVKSLGLEAVLHLPGATREVWAGLAAMDLFALTSRLEGLPNVLIEAQAASLPVVCTAVGGMGETYIEGVTGYGVPEATPEALAAKLQQLIDDPIRRRQMAESAYRHARTSFGVERMVEDTLQAYAAVPSIYG